MRRSIETFAKMGIMILICSVFTSTAYSGSVLTLKGKVRISISQDLYSRFIKDCRDCDVEITGVEMYVYQNRELKGGVPNCYPRTSLSSWSGGRNVVNCDFKNTWGIEPNRYIDVRYQVYAKILKNGSFYKKIGGRTSFQVMPRDGTTNLGNVNITIDRTY